MYISLKPADPPVFTRICKHKSPSLCTQLACNTTWLHVCWLATSAIPYKVAQRPVSCSCCTTKPLCFLIWICTSAKSANMYIQLSLASGAIQETNIHVPKMHGTHLLPCECCSYTYILVMTLLSILWVCVCVFLWVSYRFSLLGLLTYWRDKSILYYCYACICL